MPAKKPATIPSDVKTWIIQPIRCSLRSTQSAGGEVRSMEFISL